MVQTFKRKEYFVKQNTPSLCAGWIESGDFRYTCIGDDGKEHIVGYSFTGEFVCDYTSFMKRDSALVNIQAINDCSTRLAMAQFTAEGGYFLKILSDPSRTFLLSLGGSALVGYETSNWGNKTLYDGSTLREKDAFIYGGAITLELEAYLSDRVVLLLTGR